MFSEYREIIDEAESKIKGIEKKYEDEKIKNIMEIKEIHLYEVGRINDTTIQDYTPIEMRDKIVRKTEEFKTIKTKKDKNESIIRKEMKQNLSKIIYNEKEESPKSFVKKLFVCLNHKFHYYLVYFSRIDKKLSNNVEVKKGEVEKIEKYKYNGTPQNLSNEIKKFMEGKNSNFHLMDTQIKIKTGKYGIHIPSIDPNYLFFNNLSYNPPDNNKEEWDKWLALNTPEFLDN